MALTTSSVPRFCYSGGCRVLLHFGFTDKPDILEGLRVAIAQGKLGGISIEEIS
jgi:hypothetical protein